MQCSPLWGRRVRRGRLTCRNWNGIVQVMALAFEFNNPHSKNFLSILQQDSPKFFYSKVEKAEHAEFQLSRPVLPFCPFWLHTLICLNSPELHCWLSSHPHRINMLGFWFHVYVRRSQGDGTDPAKESMPRACRRGQGLPLQISEWCVCLFHTCRRKRVPYPALAPLQLSQRQPVCQLCRERQPVRDIGLNLNLAWIWTPVSWKLSDIF